MKIDKKLIKELTDYLNEFNLTELEYGDNDTKIKVSKSNSASSHIISEDKNLTSTSKKNQASSEKKITSPIIGTAYLSPEPGAKKFIDLGKKIKKGDTIMIVEAMKTMNHVPSTLGGIIKKISVKDGQAVEFGQILIVLE